MKTHRRSYPRQVLVNLPPAQLTELTRWLVNNASYRAVQVNLETQFGVVVSIETISQFWKKFLAPEINQQEVFIRSLVRKQWQERLSRALPEADTVGTPGSSPKATSHSAATSADTSSR